MFNIKGFQLSEKVYESKRSVIYRGLPESDNLPVIVKFLRAKYPTREGWIGLSMNMKFQRTSICPVL